ncbi:hypothetical protein F0562_000233 [Nyssa sinensis]|uniref:CW-type domain-containing protein n=1 Tax=Nyssa sinensis TaxID=561372 RepID=A0A5J5C311_9ASTE|nr:hypothetical protein F0562_000233 [Nyssa sinensis]
MEEAELEEGEACYYKDDASIDPDIALSYLDEKLQSVLGHFQKDFEGGVSAETLGAKFGWYGSFLPTYQCSPSIWSQPKGPQRVQNHAIPRSPNNLPVGGAPQNSTDPSDAPLSRRLGSASYGLHSLQIAKIPSGDVSSGKENTEGNSPEESGGMPFESQETPDESPSSILEIMTSFPVPRDLLLSALGNSLLCLKRKEKLSQNSKPMPALKGSPEHSVVLVDVSASILGDGKLSKEKKTKSVGKSEILVELDHGNEMDFEDNMTFLSKNNTENKTLKHEQCFSSDVKLKTLSNSTCNAEMPPEAFREGEKGASVKKREASKDGLKDEFAKESLGSISSHVSVDLREDGRGKSNKISSPFKVDSDVSKYKRDPNTGAMGHLKHKVGQKSTSLEDDEIKIPHGVEKSSFESKERLKGRQNNGKGASDLSGESLMIRACVAPKDTKKTIKIHNLNSRKIIHEACDNYGDVLADTRLEHMDNQMDSLERLPGNRAKDSDLETVEKEWHPFFDKSKQRSGCLKFDTQSTSEPFLKEDPNVGPPRGGIASVLEPTSEAPVVMEEYWVCCDRCQKWRLLPLGVKPEHLHEKWFCSMLDWLPGLNCCDISKEETTKALNTLYQVPLPESQNDLQKHAHRTALGVTSADVRHFDHTHQNLSSHAMPNRGKKKNVSKELPYKASDGGNAKQRKQADQYGDGATKKIKTEGAIDNDNYRTSEHGRNLERVGHSSNTDLPTKKAGKNMQKHKEDYYSKDIKCDPNNTSQISVKKEGDYTQIPLYSGSLDMKTYDEREISVKKRKLKDRQDRQNYLQTLQSNRKHHLDSNVSMKEESVDSECKKEKKSRVSSIEGKESTSTSKGDDRSNEKGRLTRILLSGSRDNSVHVMEGVRSIEKDQQPRRHKANVASKPPPYPHCRSNH